MTKKTHSDVGKLVNSFQNDSSVGNFKKPPLKPEQKDGRTQYYE